MKNLWNLLGKITLLIGIPLAFWTWQDHTKFQGDINISSDKIKIIFGNNTFVGTPNVLNVNGKQIFWAEIKNDKLFVYLTVFDKDGKVVAKLDGNKWTANENNLFKIEKTNNRIKIINQYDEVSLDASVVSGDTIKVNGVFYISGRKIIATDEGLTM